MPGTKEHLIPSGYFPPLSSVVSKLELWEERCEGDGSEYQDILRQYECELGVENTSTSKLLISCRSSSREAANRIAICESFIVYSMLSKCSAEEVATWANKRSMATIFRRSGGFTDDSEVTGCWTRKWYWLETLLK